MNAIQILRKSGGLATKVEQAVALHDACPDCKGHGGNVYYPEQPCPGCGFTTFDSVGVEEVQRKSTEGR